MGVAAWLGMVLVLASGNRVDLAVQRHQPGLQAAVERTGMAWPPKELFLRAYKAEGVVEAWVGNGDGALRHLKDFPVCAASGGPGPKRSQGDGQVPEGFYEVDRFNPASAYHLSLGLNYPNASDRLRAVGPPGGDIFIHGNCVTIGCLPLGDAGIEELYVLASEVRKAHRGRIPVHVFPARMGGPAMAALRREHSGDAALLAFWQELEPVHASFEAHHRVPAVKVGKGGSYRLKGAGTAR